MKIELNPTKAEIFQQIFQNIKVFTDAITLHIGPENGLYLQCMDSSHVSITQFTIPVSWFETFEVNIPTLLSFQSSLFAKIMATRDKIQSVVLWKDDDNDNLTITFENPTGVSTTAPVFRKEFSLPLMEIENDLLNIPEEQEYAVEVSMPSAYFASLITQLQQFGSDAVFDCSEEQIVLSSSTQESGSMRILIDIDRLDEFSIDEGETIRVSYALGYLSKFCGFHKLTKQVKLNLSGERPMKLEYQMEGNWTMEFFLAPKIDDGE